MSKDIFFNVPVDSIVDDWPYTLSFVAVLLDRSVAGLRWSLSQTHATPESTYINFLRHTRRRIGRRSYWSGADLKRLIRGDYQNVQGVPK